MDISDLGLVGCNTLNVADRAGVTAALTKLQGGSFWGVITTSGGDYFIAVTQGAPAFDEYPPKTYHYCVNSGDAAFTFTALSEGDEAKFELRNGYELTGDPAAALEEEVFAEPEEGEEQGADLTFREANALANVVRAIDEACAIVPKGSHIINASNCLVKNAAFAGLTLGQATDLGNYCFNRSPQYDAAAWARKSGMVAADAVLDTLNGTRPAPLGETPAGAYAAVANLSKTAVSVRSLYYPGYEFFSVVGSNKYGGAYFGNGKANQDLAFN
jgi:hypothetical protein